MIVQKNHDRGKNCMKNLCLDLRKQVTKIINYEKKEMIPLKEKKRTGIIIKQFVIYVKKYLKQVMIIKKYHKI